MTTTESIAEREKRQRYEDNRPENYDPPSNGATFRNETCGCRIVGDGNLPSPLQIDYCAPHASVEGMVEALERIRAFLRGEDPIGTSEDMVRHADATLELARGK